MVPLYKRKKGSQQWCDDYRGLLLANHASLAFVVGQIKGRIAPLYNSKISLSQCGAVPGRGADPAAHAARPMPADTNAPRDRKVSAAGLVRDREDLYVVHCQLLGQSVSRDRKRRLQDRHEGQSEPYAGEVLRDTC